MSYIPPVSKKKAYGQITLTEKSDLLTYLDAISSPVKSVCPEPMEKFDQDYGFIMYTTHVTGPRENCLVDLIEVHDRALIFLNDEYIGVIERWDKDKKVYVSIPHEGAKLWRSCRKHGQGKLRSKAQGHERDYGRYKAGLSIYL